MNYPVQRRSAGRRDTGTRERLLAAAQDCLRADGLAGTSSRAIAERSGANLAAITYHFGSKDLLITAALAAELGEWMQPVIELLREQRDPAARLLDAVQALNTRFDEQRDRAPGLLEVFVHAARETDPQNPVVVIWTGLRARLAMVIDELRSTSAIPAWVSPDAMAALVIAVAAGTVVSVTVEPDGVGHREIASQFVALLLAAATEQDRSTPR